MDNYPCYERGKLMNKMIKKLLSDKHRLKYMAACVFVVAAGVTYSISRMTAGADNDIKEYSAGERQGVNTELTTDTAGQIQTEAPTKKQIYVYICGAVSEPGVYQVAADTRVYEGIAQAGGCTEGADLGSINLADKLSDGQKVYVPVEGETVSNQAQGTEGSGSMVNINTATVSELTTLPGIGESRAKDIINYRTKNGFFTSTEDIMNVSGIKEAAYEKIKDRIKV